MGKMRFKLSHVMPHAWFYKLKEVGKPGRSITFKASEPRKAAYASPINHKAIDIPFPADTPKKNSLVEPPFTEDFTALDQLHLVELSDECRPSIVLPHSSASRLGDKMINFSLDADDPLSAPDVKAGAVTCGVSFDVRELERRLKALGSEDRRKYYTSPMLLSVAVPSPMIGDGIHSGIVRTLDGGLDAQDSSLDMCANGFSLNVFGSNDEKRSYLMNADDKRPFCATNYGDALCRSIDESNRHSTSSSDTGFERGSSSMWERDAFSITSDGSEAFTTTCADDVESMHKSRQRFRRLRERTSPSLYATVHMNNGLSRFCDDNQEAVLAENDMMNGFYEDVHITEGEIDQVSHANICVHDVAHDESDRGLYVHNSGTCVDDLSRKKMSNYNSYERPFSIPSPRKPSNFSSKHEGSVGIGTRCLVDYEDMSDSLSMQYDGNDLLSAQYDSSDDRQSDCTRKSSGEFSYARCKERLLSSRISSGQSRNWIMREGEKEKASNYTQFKLKQRSFEHSKDSSGGMYLDPGLYNNVSRGKQSYAYDNTDSTDMDSTPSTSTIPSRFELHNSDLAQLRRSRTSIYHIKSPHHGAKGLAGQVRSSRLMMQDQGSSWFKGTLRAVREKTRDPSFEQFAPSGGMTPTRGERSRVFDSFAMVKCSYDPKHDFKESMVEMIMEKDLHTSHDMVELLQCYLTLNADAYHDSIVKVFTEVWSEMFQHI